MHVVAILLAAGASRRMGTPKPLLWCQGEPLVRRMARTLREGGAAEVFVITAPGEVGGAIAEALADLEGVEAVINPSPERGMLSSVQEGLRTALRQEGVDGLLVCPCDLPKLRPMHVALVLEAGRRWGEAITVPLFRGQRGHPTLFGVKLADEILHLNPLEFGLNEILKRHARDVRDIAVSEDAVLRDADTPEEWRALQEEMEGTTNRGYDDGS